jgi:hypothetical protein
MIQRGLAGIGTLLIVVALVAGVAALGAPAIGDAQADSHPQHVSGAATPSEVAPTSLNDSEVGLELRPADMSADPGETVTYDVVINGTNNGVIAYEFNVTAADPSVAQIENFTLDRDGLLEESFITDDNSTVKFEVALGSNEYAPAAEITVATIDVTAVGSVGDSTTLEFDYPPNGSVQDGNQEFYDIAAEQPSTLDVVGTAPVFQVSNLDPAAASVVAGETLNISADIENVGVSGNQTVLLDIDGYSENTTVALAGGANETVTFEAVDTGALGPGTYNHTISTLNDTVSGNLTVLAAAEFAVDIVETTTPVAGEPLDVTVQVENLGDVEGTQTVALDAGPLGTDETNVTLASEATTETTLSVGTGTDDAGEYTATVSSADAADSTNVTVEQPVFFDVTIPSVDDPVTEGEMLTVAYDVTNTGDVQATQNITFAVNGTTEDTETGVTLNGSEMFSGQFTYATAAGDAPAVSVAVSSDDDSTSETVTVNEPAFFAVDIVETTTPVAGESLTVTVQVENPGDVEGTQTVALDAGALGTDETNVTLAGGTTTETTLSVGTESGDEGSYAISVSSADDTDTADVTVLQPAFFEVEITAAESVTGGETATVEYTVENVGDVEATQNITFAVEGSLEGTNPGVTLGSNGTLSDSFSYETVGADAPGVFVTVASADDAATANVTVLEPAAFTVELVERNEPLVAGEQVNVTVDVENTGGTADSRLLQVDVGPLGQSERVVDLAGNESTEQVFSFDSATEQTGTYNVTVDIEDDVATGTLELRPTSLPTSDTPPQDLDGNGRYEDVDGNDRFDIFDIQAFFTYFDTELIQQHTPAFNFDNDGGISIVDVQALFALLGE